MASNTAEPEPYVIESSRFERTSAIWYNTNLLFQHLDRDEPIDPDSSTATLIQSGCDVQAWNHQGQTLLHAAVKASSVQNEQALIKSGADVNAPTVLHKETPLVLALRCKRPEEMVAMLLFYGAEVNNNDGNGETPFTTRYGNETTRELLYQFCDKDRLVRSLMGWTCMASEEKDRWVTRLVEDGAEVNYVNDRGDHHLLRSMFMERADLFKLIWTKIDDHKILTKLQEPLLTYYLTNAKFNYTSSDWLDCLCLMLGSPVAQELVEDVKLRDKTWGRTAGDSPACLNSFFTSLLSSFQLMKIGRNDRVALIYLLASFDLELHESSIESLHQVYGFGEELLAVLNTSRICTSYVCFQYNTMFKVLDFQMGYFLAANTKSDPTEEKVVNYLKNLIVKSPQRVLDVLGFFSLSFCLKQDILGFAWDQIGWDIKCSHPRLIETSLLRFKAIDKLCAQPEFPSLVELGRNQARVFIKRKFNVQHPYQFYDALKALPIPKPIEDIICFKKPLY